MKTVLQCVVVLFALITIHMPVSAALLNVNHLTSDGNSLLVKTPHVEARFDGPSIVYLKNMRTSEIYTAGGRPVLDLGKVKVQNTGDRKFTLGSWSIITSPRTAIYKGRSNDTTYTMSVHIENGQLVIRCSGESETTGVSGITWGIGNLSLAGSSAVLPVKAGRVLSSKTNTASESFDYPTHWEAQFAVIQGKEGAACIYSTDKSMQFKRLDTLRLKDTYSLIFQTDNQAPFTDLKKVESVEWRIDCLKGDWRAAVNLYKKQMTNAGFVRQYDAAAKQRWPKQIRGHVRVGGDFTNTNVLDELAKRVIPDKTLLYLADWRKDGYDVNYPDYTAKPGIKDYVKHAQELGFRVMLHVDLPGMSPTHPAYEQVKQYHVRDSVSLGPIGWLWDKDVPQRFAFINPAASEFRKIFVDAMRGVVRDYNPNAVHLDVSGPMWNDGNGLIEGMNYCQGSVMLHRELLEALPDLVLVGESINEILAPYEHFAQRWAWECSLDPHPVCDYFFSGLTQSYGYLGQPNPDASPAGFLQYIKPYESQGVAPTMVVNSIDDLDGVGARRWFSVIQTWQEHDLSPDWSSKWPDNTLFKMKGGDKTEAVIERTVSGVRMIHGNKVLYERIEGVSSIEIQGHITSHYAYSKGKVFGLDPKRCYWVESGGPDLSLPRITSLSGDVMIEEARVSDDLISFGLTPGSKNIVLDMWDSINTASVGTVLHGKREPVERGATFYAIFASVNGVPRQGIVAHPPWLPREGGSDYSLGQTYAVYTVDIPDLGGKKCLFESWLGINDEAKDSDGVTFIVKINNKEVLRRHVTKTEGWQKIEVDLAQHSGKSVDIEIITDPGPNNNTNWDQGVWGMPRVTLSGRTEYCSADLELPKQPMWSVPADIVSTVTGNYVAEVTVKYKEESGSEYKHLLLPSNIYFVYKEPDLTTLPCDLTSVTYSTGLSLDGCYRKGSAWGGGTPETLKIDGVERKAINAHPPANGRTVLTWLLQLPENKAVLEFTAGVKPNAGTSGVRFMARVNGHVFWEKPFTRPEWQKGSVDLSRYAGQKVVLELITDSMGEEFCDWASWVEPWIVEAKN